MNNHHIKQTKDKFTVCSHLHTHTHFSRYHMRNKKMKQKKYTVKNATQQAVCINKYDKNKIDNYNCYQNEQKKNYPDLIFFFYEASVKIFLFP